MKIRTDFVTNSSSSSFCVAITITDKANRTYQLHVDPTDQYLGGGGEAMLSISEKKVFGASDITSLVTLLTDSIVFPDADVAFEELDADCTEYSVKAIRKLLKKCDEPYFSGVLADVEKFRAVVEGKISSLSEIATVRIENTHSCWGEFSDLLESYLDMVEIPVPEEENLVEGRTFVITGKLEYFANREGLSEYIEEQGGEVAKSVTHSTDYLINNDASSTASKNKKAMELGVPVITEEEFIRLFCDKDSLDPDIVEQFDEFPEFRERIDGILRKHLAEDSSFDELVECIEEGFEPNAFEGTQTALYDMDSHTVKVTTSITI